MGALDIVAEGEERIACKAGLGIVGEPCLLFLTGEGYRLLGKGVCPHIVADDVLIIVGEEHVDGVVALGAAQLRTERQRQHELALPQKPFIGLVAGQTRAVDAGLLACADADRLSEYALIVACWTMGTILPPRPLPRPSPMK